MHCSSECTPICPSLFLFFFFSSRRRHTRSLCDWSSDVCSSDLAVADVLSTAAMFCLPSHWEGLPLSVLEAMASGCAVIRSEERRVGKECRSRWSREHEKERGKRTLTWTEESAIASTDVGRRGRA